MKQLVLIHPTISSSSSKPWKLIFILNRSSKLVSHLQVVFHHEVWSVNTAADCLAEQGVDRSVSLDAFLKFFPVSPIPVIVRSCISALLF